MVPYEVSVKSAVKILSIFVAFLENTNFIDHLLTISTTYLHPVDICDGIPLLL